MIALKTPAGHALSLSANAYDTIAAVERDPLASFDRDVTRVRAGLARAALLHECLAGADGAAVVAGWREYVAAVISAADGRAA